MLPPGPELAVGARTRRIATVYTGSRATRDAVAPTPPAPPAPLIQPTPPTPPSSPDVITAALPAPAFAEATAGKPAPVLLAAPPPLPAAVNAAPRALARISYEDDAGAHDYAVIKASVSIGRGGVAYPIDVRITSSTDVSREHARIRHDAEKGHFCLIDLSSLGTTVNGAPVPRGYDDADGSKRENGVEVVLPERARIGLANVVFLDFRVER
jgi:hypothetical protein